MKIQNIEDPAAIDFLTQKINQSTFGFGSATPFGFCVKDDHGEIIAGCNGFVMFGSIYTDQLWVHPAHRRCGIGRELMEKVHALGRDEKCTMATVITMSFQDARAFYESLGYQGDFERFGYVKGSSCLFLRKDL